jgi:hypothetical protein
LLPEGGAPLPAINVSGERVRIERDAEVRAVVAAPNGHVTVGDGARLVGGFCSRTFASGGGAELACDDAPLAPGP